MYYGFRENKTESDVKAQKDILKIGKAERSCDSFRILFPRALQCHLLMNSFAAFILMKII